MTNKAATLSKSLWNSFSFKDFISILIMQLVKQASGD